MKESKRELLTRSFNLAELRNPALQSRYFSQALEEISRDRTLSERDTISISWHARIPVGNGSSPGTDLDSVTVQFLISRGTISHAQSRRIVEDWLLQTAKQLEVGRISFYVLSTDEKPENPASIDVIDVESKVPPQVPDHMKPLPSHPLPDRAEAVRRFLEGVASSKFCSTGPYPSRDSLHDRD